MTASRHHGTARVDDQVPERRHIIFDPIPRVDGSESSDDPLTEVRADLSLLSGAGGGPSSATGGSDRPQGDAWMPRRRRQHEGDRHGEA